MTSFPLAEISAPTTSRAGGLQTVAMPAAMLQSVSAEGAEGKLLAEGGMGPLKAMAFADLLAAASVLPTKPVSSPVVAAAPLASVVPEMLPEASASSTSRLALASTLMAAKTKVAPVEAVLETAEAAPTDLLAATGEAAPVTIEGLPVDFEAAVAELGVPAEFVETLSVDVPVVATTAVAPEMPETVVPTIVQVKTASAEAPDVTEQPDEAVVVASPVQSMPVAAVAQTSAPEVVIDVEASPEPEIVAAAVATAAPAVTAPKQKTVAEVERVDAKQKTELDDSAPLEAAEVISDIPQDVIAPIAAPIDVLDQANVQPAPIEEARPATPSVSAAVPMPNGAEAVSIAAQPTIQAAPPQPNTSAAPAQMVASQAQLAMLDGEWPAGFVQSVGAMVGANGETMTLTLTPERLGTLQIRLAVQDGVTNVHIVTDTPEAARLFNEAQGRLGELMARAGIEMGSISSSTSAPATQSAGSNSNNAAFNQSMNQNLSGQTGGQGAGNGSGAGQDGQRGGQTAQQSQPAASRPEAMRSATRSQSTTSVDVMA